MAAFLVMTSGCSMTTLRPVSDELSRDDTGLRLESGQRIAGYELSGGDSYEYEGWARLVRSDSLEFWTDTATGEPNKSVSGSQVRVPGLVFPLPEVKALKVVQPSHKWIWISAIGLFLVVGAVYVSILNMDLGGSDQSSWGLVK